MHWEEPCISDSSRQNPWPHQDKEKRGWFLGTMHKITFLCRLPSSVAALMLLVFESSASRSVVSDSLRPHELYSLWNSPGQNTGVGSHSFLQGIFPTQRSNSGILLCRWILYLLSHQGSPLFLIFHLIAPASFQCFKTLLQNSHWNWKLPNYHYKGTKSLLERRRQGPRTIAYVNYLCASEKTAFSTFGLLFSNIKWEL